MTDDAPVADEPIRRRWWPARIGGYVYLGVVAAGVIGLVVVAGGEWRAGVRWISAGLALGGVARLLLRERDAGMLGVRNRPVDAGLLLGVAAALFVLAATIPDQPVRP